MSYRVSFEFSNTFFFKKVGKTKWDRAGGGELGVKYVFRPKAKILSFFLSLFNRHRIGKNTANTHACIEAHIECGARGGNKLVTYTMVSRGA
jgi:hypothetical protein